MDYGNIPVDINPVEPQVLDKLYARAREFGTVGRRCCCLGEAARVRPPPNGEERLELAVSLLEEVELLDAAVDVGTVSFVRFVLGEGEGNRGRAGVGYPGSFQESVG